MEIINVYNGESRQSSWTHHIENLEVYKNTNFEELAEFNRCHAELDTGASS